MPFLVMFKQMHWEFLQLLDCAFPNLKSCTVKTRV